MTTDLAAIKKWLGQGSINIFGVPFAGKDTQSNVLADLLDAQSLSGGEILRGSVIPEHVQQTMDAGNLIPTADYLRIVLPFLSHERFDDKPLMLSSVGRWHGEEEGVLHATQESGHPLKAVILLTVPEEIARKRHDSNRGEDRGARADDMADVFDTRLAEFRAKTLPVIDYYREKGLLIEIDGAQEPPAVTEAILEQLQALATS